MNPLSDLIRSIRIQRGLRQADLASLVGCSSKTITAVENGKGVGERLDLAERLGDALELAEDERSKLADAVRRSQRVYTIPEEAPMKAYDLVRNLFDKLDRLSDPEIEAINSVLSIRTDRRPALPGPTHRLVRKDKVWKSDADP